MPHSSRVGSQITGCSNLYPLNAPRVSEIWLLVFTVSCFTVNKRAQTRERAFALLAFFVDVDVGVLAPVLLL